MSIEIERKFLVNRLPETVVPDDGRDIRQGYLIITDDGTELRVRQKGTRFFQTIKTGAGLCRAEIEIDITQAQFEVLWPHTQTRRVSKTRVEVPLGGHIAEVDIFDGDLKGLVLVEVEFASEAASREFRPPDWFGAEVTDHEGYKNKNLAVHGIPARGAS